MTDRADQANLTLVQAKENLNEINQILNDKASEFNQTIREKITEANETVQ